MNTNNSNIMHDVRQPCSLQDKTTSAIAALFIMDGSKTLDDFINIQSPIEHVMACLEANGGKYDEDIMFKACTIGRVDIVKILDEADGNCLECSADIAMSNAVEAGHVAIVQYIFEKQDVRFNYLLASAVEENHLDVLKYLLQQFQTSDEDCQFHFDEALVLACKCENVEAIFMLLQVGADPYAKVYDDDGDYCRISAIDVAIERNIKINIPPPSKKLNFF